MTQIGYYNDEEEYEENANQYKLQCDIDTNDPRKIESQLRDGLDINYKFTYGNTETLLARAVRRNLFKMAEFLLNKGAKVNMDIGHYGGSYIAQAIDDVVSVEMLRLLLDRGADVDRISTLFGSTVLHRSAERDRQDMVELLLDRGADVTIKDKYGNTALELAFLPEIKDLIQNHIDRTKTLRAKQAAAFMKGMVSIDVARPLSNLPYEADIMKMIVDRVKAAQAIDQRPIHERMAVEDSEPEPEPEPMRGAGIRHFQTGKRKKTKRKKTKRKKTRRKKTRRIKNT